MHVTIIYSIVNNKEFYFDSFVNHGAFKKIKPQKMGKINIQNYKWLKEFGEQQKHIVLKN